MSFYDEIEIEDMTYHEDTTLYTYPCPCGDQFEISLGDLQEGEEVAVCPSCSLQIKVIYDVVCKGSDILKKCVARLTCWLVGCFAEDGWKWYCPYGASGCCCLSRYRGHGPSMVTAFCHVEIETPNNSTGTNYADEMGLKGSLNAKEKHCDEGRRGTLEGTAAVE